jgi:hypothetical protein
MRKIIFNGKPCILLENTSEKGQCKYGIWESLFGGYMRKVTFQGKSCILIEMFDSPVLEQGEDYATFTEKMESLTCRDCMEYKTGICHGKNLKGRQIIESCINKREKTVVFKISESVFDSEEVKEIDLTGWPAKII